MSSLCCEDRDLSQQADGERPVGAELGRTVWAVSLPVLFVELSETILHVTDTVLLGRVGDAELAAVGLADSLLEFVVVPIVGLVGAMQIVIARRDGESRLGAARQSYRVGMLTLLAVSLILSGVLFVTAGPLSGLLAQDSSVRGAVADLLRPASLSLPLLAVGLGYGALYLGLRRTRVLLGATLVLTLVNATCGYAFVLGRLGAPRLGVAGAGWAMVAAEGAAALFLLLWTRARDPLGGHHETEDVTAALRGLARLGPGIGLQAGVEAARWLLFFVIIAWASQRAAASAAVVYACYAILIIPAYALGQTAETLTSSFLGGGGSHALIWLRRRAEAAATAVTLPMSLVMLAFPEHVLRLFASEGHVGADAVPSLRVAAVVVLVAVPMQVWSGMLAGTGDVDGTFYLELLIGGVLVAATALVMLPIGGPLAWAWVGLGLAEACGLPFARWRFRQARGRAV